MGDHSAALPQRVARTDATAFPRRGGRSALPDGADIVFFSIVYLSTVLMPNGLLSDGSTGWHIVTGQFILDHLRIPHQDLISYTFPHKPWVPWEWLFDLVSAVLVRLGGLSLLVVATSVTIAWLFASLYRDARQTGCHVLIALALTLIGALASSVHWLARPHLFTFLGVYIFSRTLERFHRGEVTLLRLFLILGLTMVAWSNAHPAFLIGFAMIAIYFGSEVVVGGMLPAGEARGHAMRRAAGLLGSLVVTTVASLVNPNGVALYQYIATYWRHGSLRYGFSEWMSPSFHGDFQSTSLELMFAAFIVGLVISRRKLWLGQFALVAAFAHLALAAVRNVPLFVIVAVPVIAGLLADSNLPAPIDGDGSRRPAWLEGVVTAWRRCGLTFDKIEPRCDMHLVPIVVVSLLLFSCLAAGKIPGIHALVPAQFNPRTMPTTTLDYVERDHLAWDRGFNEDNWGGYIRYKTGNRVFIDDRMDFYDEDFYRQYAAAMGGQPGWRELFKKYGVQWALLPKDAPLAGLLAQTPDWRLVATDQAAFLFVRDHRRR
jgi:hypothetical protein